MDMVRSDNIIPVHDVTHDAKLIAIEADMLINGWIGRPLLVIETLQYGYMALTGSHRLAAAQKSILSEYGEPAEIPCEIIEATDFEAAYVIAADDGEDLWDFWGIWDDDDKLAMARKYLPQAVDLLEAEVAENNNAYNKAD